MPLQASDALQVKLHHLRVDTKAIKVWQKITDKARNLPEATVNPCEYNNLVELTRMLHVEPSSRSSSSKHGFH